MTGLGLADPARENALLVGIIDAISAGPELELLAARVADLIVAATSTDVCFVHVLDDTDRSLTLAGATPPFDSQVGRVRLQLGEGVAGWTASRREPVVIVANKDDDPRYRYFPQLRGEDYTSLVSVPMASRPGGLAGVLNVHTHARREFTERDVRLLTSIGTLLAGAIHQARTHRRLAARERAHERFTEQVIAAQEAERQRLAADIHDGITQRLVSLRFHLNAASDALADPGPDGTGFAATQLNRARELADLTLDETRAAISGLRPPVLDDLGLADSLTSLARSIPGLDVVLDVDQCELPEHAEIAIYRIAQEALQNVLKHAGTRDAGLSLHHAGNDVVLQVSDAGCGFDRNGRSSGGDPAAGGYGMTSMAERAELIGGRLEVESRPGAGTRVIARVPRESPR
ncbi:GAF domain-containing protein [Saccharomonospora sp. NPDC046836]|uniref:GAF domain-containing sensor histidine kinase n=1 Tax=Saccharomonospora sp. NPDC046836 TaxID=3156921 RepID=UPI00340EF9EA